MPSNLSGLRIAITRPPHQAQEFGHLLENLGAQVIYLPVIKIEPPDNPDALDEALRDLPGYDWVIFTSVNGVQNSLDRLQALGIQSWPDGLKVAAIGPKTGAALLSRGVEVSFRPDEYVAEAIPPGLGQISGKKFLLLRADLARPALANLIEAAGGVVDEVTAYRTVPAKPDPDTLAALQQGVDILTFTSSSTVRNFLAILRQSGLDPAGLPGSPKVACIGPITAQTARDLGLRVDLVAETYTIEGLVSALLQGSYNSSVSDF